MVALDSTDSTDSNDFQHDSSILIFTITRSIVCAMTNLEHVRILKPFR
jgi:hypothetical protein